jgi:ribonucrease Y
MTIAFIALSALVGLIVGAGLVGLFLRTNIQKNARQISNELESSARRKAEEITRDAQRRSKEAVEQARRKFEQQQQQRAEETRRAEQRAKDIEKELLDERKGLREEKEKIELANIRIEKQNQEYERLAKSAEQAEAHFKAKQEDILASLERVANLTQKEAREALIKNIEEDAKLSSARMMKQIEEDAKDNAEKEAKRIISIAVSRYSSDYIPEKTTSMVHLPSDEMKGRLIGREGRNIRAIEAATGCDLIVDDTPETVVVSSFDPVRRYIGKTVLEQLIADGRVHPTRIEELVEKVQKQVEQKTKEAGKAALLELGIVSMHPELQKVIGQLQFRYSYSQNQYYHVIEVGHLCGLMAAELGLDIKKARRAGLLHDIGKALTHEVEGSHAVIGADLCEKYGEAPDIVYAIRAHHEDVKPTSWLDFLVISGDAISGARPGARREQLDNYVRRLQDLENIANAFPGVERSFAIAAGREIRVVVENSRVNDEGAIVMSRDIAKKIEADMVYPGQIKVTVIRETRATTLAK